MRAYRARNGRVKLRKLLRASVAGLAAAASLASSPTVGRASIIERVVAVVGERPILLSELRHRARPFQYRVLATTQGAAQQAAAESEMYRDLLNRMIDDRLEEQAADKAHLAVSSDDVDAALRNIANAARISVRDLVGEAKKQGLSEQDYRDEIRRQLLEGKLVQLRVRGRVRVTEEDAKTAYGRWVKDMDQEQPVEMHILALRILPGSTDEQTKARMLFAESLAKEGRQGKDWCELVKTYSDDATTKDSCGSRGPQSLRALVPELQDLVHSLKAGEISEPIRVANEAILVVQMAKEVTVPQYDQVKDAMMERALGEAMDRQRKQWLLELRRGIYIDVRL
jgi:peptidyl-prolyl cis-trans isomerase SurA